MTPEVPQPLDPDDWQPAKARPGELYTAEGQSRATWALLRGLRDREARSKAYRRSMIRLGLLVLGLVVLVIAAVAVVVSLVS
jgi:hypothetical protein